MHDTTAHPRTRKRLAHFRCTHRGPHDLTPEQQDRTVIETCPRCGARWVIWPGGARTRALWAR